MSEAEIPCAPEPARRFYRIGDTFEVPDFKDASFVNGPFLTLVVGNALAELAVILTELYRIHVHCSRDDARSDGPGLVLVP